MKIKVTDKSYEEVMALPREKHEKPKRPNMFFRTLLRVVGSGTLKKVRFKYETVGMEKLGKKEPCLVLMNHSAFVDLSIAERIFYPRPLNIVCTSDGFVGKKGLMRNLGCIPTRKFVSDLTLIKDIKYAVTKLKSSVLMYPEASYSFDGRATPLPESVGKFVKLLGAPCVYIQTYGAFLHDPLYNKLQQRDTDVSAKVTYLLSPEEIKAMSADEINEKLKECFSFDNFEDQKNRGVIIDEPFRADGLNRVLYKCPHCMSEGKTEGVGTRLTCKSCGKQYELTEEGEMRALEGETEYSHIPDWFAWERQCVKDEITSGEYSLDVDVDICMMVDTKSIYRVGNGRLTHGMKGFHLVGCDGKLVYDQKPKASYSLYSDYHWYEIGDVICIGNNDVLYYCFPKSGDVVAKTRIATEELYRLSMEGDNTLGKDQGEQK